LLPLIILIYHKDIFTAAMAYLQTTVKYSFIL